MDWDCIMMQCSCGLVLPINRLYFCRCCVTFRCFSCSKQEILSVYCDHCFEETSLSVAMFSEGKCLTCYDCPFCFSHLTLRRKNRSFYLLCSFCSWSQSTEQPDQSKLALLNYAPRNEDIAWIADLHETKVRWDPKEFSHRNLLVSSSTKFDFTVRLQTPRLRSGTLSLLLNHLQERMPDLKPSVAEENRDSLPTDVFNSTIDLSKITTVSQRLKDPFAQPACSDGLNPIHRMLKAEKLRLCMECSHNLRVPDCRGPNYFKVNQNCFYYVPTLKVVKLEPLRYDSLSELVLEVGNCFPYNVSVSFFQNFESSTVLKNLDVVTLPKIPILLPPKFLLSPCKGVQVRFLIQPNILACEDHHAIFSFRMQYSYLNKSSTIPELVRLNSKIFINLGKLTNF